MGYIDLRARFLVEPTGFNVADNADNLARELLVAPHDDPLANRVFATEDPAHNTLVDHDDGRRLGRVTVGEGASGFNRNAHCLEVVGRHDEIFCLYGFLGVSGRPSGMNERPAVELLPPSGSDSAAPAASTL